MKKLYVAGSLLLAMMLTALIISLTDNDKIQRQREFNAKYGVYALELPDTLLFSGETIPLRDAEVRERLDRELLVNTYWQSQTILLIKRKEKWFRVIEPILKAEQIPDDFKYLALAESGLMNVVSPSGAAGFWQFLEETGLQYGLEINGDVDERYHLEKATRAACRYIKDAHNTLGSWCLAAGSFNMGIDGMKKQIEKQKVNNYFDLYLNDETARYVLRAAALKEICSDLLKYGFHIRQRDLYQPDAFRKIRVDSTVTDLVQLAMTNGTNFKTIKLLNPWLRTSMLPNPSKKSYEIIIPFQDSNVITSPPEDTSSQKKSPSKEYHQE